MHEGAERAAEHAMNDAGVDAPAGGAALIAGAGMMLATMAFHPSGRAILRDPSGAVAWLSAGVHGLALAAMPMLLYGAVVLTRRLATRGALPELALCFHAIGAVAGLLAALASGFVSTGLLARAAGETGAAREGTLLLARYGGLLNQASARVLVGMGSAAILLWSIAILRTARLPRAAGMVGIAIAGATLALLLAGRLRLDVHGFGAVVLGQAVWLVLVGHGLRRATPRA
jgi:hypothetical protein